MNSGKGFIFNIQRFSIHDGEGIRSLVFFKGCPLRCLWCSNPESQAPEMDVIEAMQKCIGCGRCLKACKKNAIDADDFRIVRDKCDRCGECADVCFAFAKKRVGEILSVDDIIDRIEKDRVFYKTSSGGVTLGGGEPLMQIDFAARLLEECKRRNLHTAIETSGYAPWEAAEEVFRKCDQVFYDLKAMDSDVHHRLTGVGNELILSNAGKLAELGIPVIFRLPLVEGLNDGSNVEATGKFVSSLGDKEHIRVEILPFHNLGKDKYKGLGMAYECEDFDRPEQDVIDGYNDVLKGMGCRVVQS